ncbi:MAG TPA: phosphoribosyltransferase family protein [Patescibacteria group bacterium]|nr:phosphoribosyltransferase family protein [Patescibacteria group bacterium]
MLFGHQHRIFHDRADAGRRLAEKLHAYAGRTDVIVLGVPRGGVAVAFEIARALHLPLDIFVSRKLGVPGHEELAFGAVSTGGVRVLDAEIVEATGISKEQIEEVTRAERNELTRRANLYRGARPPLDLAGRTVILVDDGIATGSSISAAIRALKQCKPARIVLGVPVAPQDTCRRIAREVDELVCVETPRLFHAIGQFYEDFYQVSDEQVEQFLRLAPQSNSGGTPKKRSSSLVPTSEGNYDTREVLIDVGGATLDGTLTLPESPRGIVLFAHGSGSSRLSPRNRFVARVLQSRGIATLLFDLLTREEEAVDERTGELRFDIALLAQRLASATCWIRKLLDTKNLPVGYFGASTGAAAALIAAAQFPESVCAVVSRGGRPDLAMHSLDAVRASVLLIVGGHDEPVIELNRRALAKLGCQEKQIIIIPGATHLFEEPGALEEVARIAAEWFAGRFAAHVPSQPRFAA